MGSNGATVQAIYEAFGRGDVPAILDRLADDVDWEAGAVDHGVPWLTPGRGRDHVVGFFGVLAEQVEIKRFEPTAILGDGDVVVALIEIEALIPASGTLVRDLEVHVWRFGTDGLVTAFRHVVDTHQHLLAASG